SLDCLIQPAAEDRVLDTQVDRAPGDLPDPLQVCLPCIPGIGAQVGHEMVDTAGDCPAPVEGGLVHDKDPGPFFQGADGGVVPCEPSSYDQHIRIDHVAQLFNPCSHECSLLYLSPVPQARESSARLPAISSGMSGMSSGTPPLCYA